jgi:hypothetical protein
MKGRSGDPRTGCSERCSPMQLLGACTRPPWRHTHTTRPAGHAAERPRRSPVEALRAAAVARAASVHEPAVMRTPSDANNVVPHPHSPYPRDNLDADLAQFRRSDWTIQQFAEFVLRFNKTVPRHEQARGGPAGLQPSGGTRWDAASRSGGLQGCRLADPERPAVAGHHSPLPAPTACAAAQVPEPNFPQAP